MVSLFSPYYNLLSFSIPLQPPPPLPCVNHTQWQTWSTMLSVELSGIRSLTSLRLLKNTRISGSCTGKKKPVQPVLAWPWHHCCDFPQEVEDATDSLRQRCGAVHPQGAWWGKQHHLLPVPQCHPPQIPREKRNCQVLPPADHHLITPRDHNVLYVYAAMHGLLSVYL